MTLPSKHWLLKLVPTGRYGKPVTGVALFLILYPLFHLGARGDLEDRTPALFFSLVMAYIIPVFSYITAKAEEAICELRPLLALNDNDFEATYQRLSGAPLWVIAAQLISGALFGIVHWSSLEGSFATALAGAGSNLNELVSTLGTLLTWIVMTSVISMLVQQAVVFARLGAGPVTATPFNVRSLAPFARVSISASLATIGALALFPLIGLEGGLNLMEVLPGAAAIIAPLIAMFLLPVWPLHRRLADMKQHNLVGVDRLIGESLNSEGFITAENTDSQRLTLLLTYRRELEECATWPFDVGNFSRLALYMIIPPMTWVAAALMENVVDSVL